MKYLTVVAFSLLTACAQTTVGTAGRSATPELARPGSISRVTGAVVPLRLCQSAARIVAAARIAPELRRVGYVCGAARGL